MSSVIGAHNEFLFRDVRAWLESFSCVGRRSVLLECMDSNMKGDVIKSLIDFRDVMWKYVRCFVDNIISGIVVLKMILFVLASLFMILQKDFTILYVTIKKI